MTLEEFFRSLGFYETRGASYLSQLCHLPVYKLNRSKMQLETGMLIISIDIDVGSAEVGVINKGKNDSNVHNVISEYRVGKIEETALPLFVENFTRFEIPVTFGIRGQATELADSPILLLLESSVKHDLGAHGYYHREFTNLSRYEAEKELSMISSGMKKLGIIPRSFIFPKNQVAYLDLLEKHKYKSYRSRGGIMRDRLYIERCGELYHFHPSLYIDKYTNFMFLKKMLDVSINKKLPFHIWFHLWNFGETKESMQRTINKVFVPLFNYAKTKETSGVLTFETMLSATEKLK